MTYAGVVQTMATRARVLWGLFLDVILGGHQQHERPSVSAAIVPLSSKVEIGLASLALETLDTIMPYTDLSTATVFNRLRSPHALKVRKGIST